MEIRGEKGITVSNHVSLPSYPAYASLANDDSGTNSAQVYRKHHRTCISGFPNFFILMGPNTLSGHLLVTYTTECRIGLIMHLMSLIIKLTFLSRFSLHQKPVAVAIQPAAEESHNEWLQLKTKQLVWAT